jgi:hypothetical protein
MDADHRVTAESSQRREVPVFGVVLKTAPVEASLAPVTSEDRAMVEGMMAQLEPLDLSEDQSVRAAAIFDARAQELRSWQGAIRKSGVFNPEEYGRNLQQRRETWYRSMDALLDSSQHARFQELMAHGFLGQGTEFVVDRHEMTVVR